MINWKEKTVKLDELVPLENNPHVANEDQEDELMTSIDDVGNFSPIICDFDQVHILGGNKRFNALKRLGETETRISVPDRELSEEERQRIILLSNMHKGAFDLDILKLEFDEVVLEDLGFDMPPEVDFDGSDSQAKINQATKHKCPECGYEF